MANVWSGLIEEYRNRLPLEPGDPVVTLFEGNTPLVRASRLEERVALASEAVGVDASGTRIYVKFEGANPTGSFKDRGMTMAMTKVKAAGTQMVACASTGNTSASAAAYAVAAGVECAVVLPAGKIALGKLAQAVMHGARLVAVDGNFDDCLRITRELTEKYPVALVNSINPYRLQGQKTAAFEICDALGDAPDIHVLPVGNAGNISAYWMGYNEYFGHKVASSIEDSAMRLKPQSTKVPRMWGIQAEGAAPFVAGKPVENPETVATAIRIGNPASWDYAVAARDDSQGLITAVSDAAIMEAQAILAAEVGVFCEPASAASVAGLLALAAEGKVPAGAKIVCTLTGNGLKDTATAMENRGNIAPQVIAPELSAAVTALGL
ncbi:threonine synthase [Mobiluncus mulieris 28-1]|uniref:Threonine synthase n=2 Tax=Mobiluncus mulieris TaxID=2052 RepID=E0QTT2_9ACTO|nr:threonine synthase [Mobiluncus mulieris]EEZ91244.1 threonine synthase [Mobiluncus mulieris 28-1]EFM45126.1 threonine synthase [Mobiluncus mulieris ATCC 35239]MBB5845304.1 threonine synthase [Mobiluncus mulieris]MCU9975161.1 threonine synthase [Mobiluncus mulieris]MCU9993825.1 threonine synthase [Mobiluncus mulieris]